MLTKRRCDVTEENLSTQRHTAQEKIGLHDFRAMPSLVLEVLVCGMTNHKHLYNLGFYFELTDAASAWPQAKRNAMRDPHL